jgi:hypothetical protein
VTAVWRGRAATHASIFGRFVSVFDVSVRINKREEREKSCNALRSTQFS